MSEEKQLPQAQKFTNTVLNIFGNARPNFEITAQQKALISGYYIKCSEALAKQDIKWSEVNMTALAMDLMNKARLGLDMTMKNVLFPIPFKNKKTGKVTLNLINGYEGEKQIRKMFAEDSSVEIKTELVYKNDIFTPQKVGGGDSYTLEIPYPFSRGDIVGGFGYITYSDSRKNKLVIMTLQDMEKRKPTYAKEEFWGDWKDKMLEKTLVRETCTHISIDPRKVAEFNELVGYEEEREVEIAKEEADSLIAENANKGELIDCEL